MKIHTLLAGLLAITVLTACGTYSYTEATIPVGKASYKPRKTWSTSSGYADINMLRVKRYGDIAHGNAMITSTSNSDREIQYHFIWLDKDNFEVGNAEPWQPMILYKGETKQIQSVAPNPSATHFTVRIRAK